jgi:hypothetical protein
MCRYLTRRLLGRSKARQQRRVSLWVLVWICLSQFPIPLAHAHADIAPDDSRLASHIESKHSNGHDLTESLHWHLVMPWETGDEEGEETPTHHPSPLGLWGAQGNVLPQAETITDFPLIALDWVAFDSGDPAMQATGSRWDTSPRPASMNFTQTYLGVPLCTLVCVCLR